MTTRRSFLQSAAGILAGAEIALSNLNSNSSPSQLKITDLRVAVTAKSPMTIPLIRIDTNQGISGFGEVYAYGSKTYALMLKSRVLGENPCNVDRVFRKIKQFGFHARQAGGVSGVEMALWDLAGKAYGVPVYQMLGGKFRDQIRCYADTDMSPDPKIYGQRMKQRLDKGFTFLKMDLGIGLVERTPGALTRPLGLTSRDTANTQHMFTGFELTDKGVALMADYVAQVREVVGMEVPLAADHFGHIGVNSCIRLGKALTRYNLAWLEDMIPWRHADLLKQIADAVDIPILTGEDIYLKESFLELFRKHAIDMIQPDVGTAGGVLEAKKVGDLAQEYGIPMVLHCAGTPVASMAAVHCAAASDNFLVLEHHSVDVPWWDDMVEGVEKPIVSRGYIRVPDKPGLGVTLNDEVVKQHLLEPGYFEPTPQWDRLDSWDRLWS